MENTPSRDNSRIVSPIEKGPLNKIGKISAKLAVMILTFVQKRFVQFIGPTIVRNGLNLIFNPIVESIKALSDADPNNRAQMEEIWKHFLNSSQLQVYSRTTIYDAAGRITTPEVRAGVMSLAIPFNQMFPALGDSNPHDGAQIAKIYTDFIRSSDSDPIFLAGIVPFVNRLNIDQETKDLIILFIQQALDQAHDNDPNQPKQVLFQ